MPGWLRSDQVAGFGRKRRLVSSEYAWNGDAAAKLLGEAGHFDVLFTDVKMPGIVDGVALAALARRQDPKIAVLVVSGYAENLANRLGALDPPAVFMSKPYELPAVVNALRRLTTEQ